MNAPEMERRKVADVFYSALADYIIACGGKLESINHIYLIRDGLDYDITLECSGKAPVRERINTVTPKKANKRKGGA